MLLYIIEACNSKTNYYLQAEAKLFLFFFNSLIEYVKNFYERLHLRLIEKFWVELHNFKFKILKSFKIANN